MQLGNILVRKKLISSEQLNQALGMQLEVPHQLGEILLKLGCIQRQELESALLEQYWRKNGFWVID